MGLSFQGKKSMWIAALGAAAGIIVSSFELPGGGDLYRYYIPFAKGCLDCGFAPYFAQWILAPLRLLPPYPLAWPVWNIVCAVGFLAIAYKLDSNPLLLLLSFPMLAQFWGGQIDMLVAFGLTIFLLSGDAYLRGLGLVLALMKPQLTALPILLSLFIELPGGLLRMSIAPLAVGLISLIAFGFDWPLRWLHNATLQLPPHPMRLASLDVWKFGLVLIPLAFLFRGPRSRLHAGLVIGALASPYFGVYSYVLFLLFEVRWWHVLLSYAWLIAFPLMGQSAFRFEWILPLSILAQLVITELRTRRHSQLTAAAPTVD